MCGLSNACSLLLPSTHGLYLPPSSPSATQPISLFPPLLPPKTTKPSPLGLKEKESIKSLNHHPSASMGRRAGELIAFFKSGASGTGRPVSPTKSEASFVSTTSGMGAAAAVKPRSSNGSGLFGPMPGKMRTSLSTFTRTFTGTGGSGSVSVSAAGSCSEGTYSPERAVMPTQGQLEGGFSQGPSTHGRRSQTYQPSGAYTQDTTTYTQGSGTYTQSSSTYIPVALASHTKDSGIYTQGSDTYSQGLRSPPPPPVPPKSPATPWALRQRTSLQIGKTGHLKQGIPYTANIPLTPKTIETMTPRAQAGAITPRTPGGRIGKALSEASTAPTSAEGMLRQHMSREIVTSVPVPSKSEAIGLGHNGQD
ncbi:hypothetical protein FRC07_014924 [Ceratobasidium sp. 392]|nr:hypothetical protein FRC07_014924 [Ceratobasidium sp. 392]